MPPNSTKSRFYSKSKEVRFNSSPEIHVYRDGIFDTTEYSQGTTGSRRYHTPDYQTVSFSSPIYGMNFPFLSHLGKLSAAADFVLLGRLHLRPLQMCPLSHFFPIDHYVLINNMIQFHLKWWMDTNRFASGMSIHPPEPTAFLFTDASHSGCGAHLKPMSLSWSEDQSQLHVNILEMMAIRLPLLCYDLAKQYNSGLLYQQTRRNTFAQLMRRSMENPPLVPGIRYSEFVRVCHIPGKFNLLADRLSRLDRPVKTEWALDQSVANAIFQMPNYPNVDLFATQFNHKLPLYVYIVPDNHALMTDTLSIDWNCLHAYAFPPTILIPSVLAKIRQSQCRIVLIPLLWPHRPWFSELLQLLVSAPVRLPLFPRLLTQANRKFQRPNLPLLQLHAWELSNNQLDIKGVVG